MSMENLLQRLRKNYFQIYIQCLKKNISKVSKLQQLLVFFPLHRMTNAVECIITVETDKNQRTILTTTSASTSLLMQRSHNMECALYQQPST
jgi:ABC-type long-subunit fatty acid transport system fused permease/ATPase subunit